MRRQPRACVLAAVLGLVLLGGCGDRDGPATPNPTTTGADSGTSALRGSITVFAAASLTESFGEIGKRFETANPGAEVTFSFDASSTLVQQVKAGAPADVLATADEATMQQAVEAKAVAAPAVFARNRLSIIVARGNPKGIRTVADLGRSGLVVVLCAPDVPCGRFGSQILTRAGVSVTPKSLEPNVKGVVSKVVLGEADAGIVYATDVKAAGDKTEGVDIPVDQNVVASYPIAVVRDARSRAVAAAFVNYVRTGEGRSVLGTFGFDPGL
jgi:molybdate transport system substrate-binding protein